MSRLRNCLRTHVNSRRPSSATSNRSTRLTLETLEDRMVQSATVQPTYVLHHAAAVGGANTSAIFGYTPAQIRAAYRIDKISFGGVTGDGSGQTIAIIDAFDDPSFVNSTDANFLSSDLHKFDQQFGLPDPPSFKKVAQDGSSNYPSPDAGWSAEIALDVEWAHAIAPKANILLVEANDNSYDNLVSKSVTFAKQQAGVSVVTMSFGGGEFSGETSMDGVFKTPSGHGGVTFLASTGDNGAPGGFPSWSANVIAVGGTSLYLNNGSYSNESGWSGGGGGVSQYEAHPAFQNSVSSSGTRRETPDVSFDADPNTGVAIYDSYGTSSPWLEIGGTSLSSPCFAGIIAIANQGRARAGLSSLDSGSQTLPMLYALPASDFHDITTGNNGYAAGAGYDMVTGRGSPVANLLVRDLVSNTGGGGGTASYQLNRNGDLIETLNGSSFRIDINVETFGVTGSGTVLDLTNAGAFRQYVSGSWYQLDTNVQWICIANNGSVFDLQKGGALWANQGSGWFKMDNQVESISMTPGGALFNLERSGNLWEYFNNSWYHIDSGVQQFAAMPSGAIYDLQRGGTLWASQGGGWFVMDSNVQSIATTPDGALFDLQRGGNLWEYANNNWYHIDSSVQSFWATADGAIYDLQRGGTLYGAAGTGSRWYVVDTNVASFYATLGGQLYDLQRGGTFWANLGGGWFVMDRNVQTMYVTCNGNIYDLQQSGNLWANQGGSWFLMDRGVKQFAATAWGALYDLQNGGNFYGNQTGNWYLVHSGVTSFVLNADGSVTYYYYA
jgi:hypothetical protein